MGERSIQARILEILLGEGFTKDQLAKAAGFESRRMIDYTLQRSETSASAVRQIGRKSLERMATNLGMSIDELYARATQIMEPNKPNPDDFRYIPLKSAQPLCGFGGEETDGEVKKWLAFRYDWLSTKGNPDKMSLFHVLGDSMSGTLENGDLILVDESQKQVITGLIYLVLVNENLMVKRASVKLDGIEFLSDNTRYDPIFLAKHDESQSVIVHGRVIWAAHEF